MNKQFTSVWLVAPERQID